MKQKKNKVPIKTYRLKLPKKPIYEEINRESAKVWNECQEWHWLYTLNKGFGCSVGLISGDPTIELIFDKEVEGYVDARFSKSQNLHCSSRQQIRRQYFGNWKGYLVKRENGDEKARPPTKKKTHMTTIWIKTAIRFQEINGQKSVKLSMGLGRDPLIIDLPKNFDISVTDSVTIIELIYKNGDYWLHFVEDQDPYPQPVELPEKHLSIDLGEVHPMVTFDGNYCQIYNGRYLRSLYQYRSKFIASINRLIDRCKEGSIRHKKLLRRKRKKIEKIDNQIRNGLHQHTNSLVKHCVKNNITEVTVGDVKYIRNRINFGKKQNQKLHLWPFAKVIEMLTHKLAAVGIKVRKISEAYTSKTCPSCNQQNKPNNRNYSCSSCGYKYHRDGIGAINIWRWSFLKKKDIPHHTKDKGIREKILEFIGELPVVATMSSPIGIRLAVRVLE